MVLSPWRSLALAVVIGAAGALAPGSPTQPGAMPSPRARVTLKTFAGRFRPNQVVAAEGAIWLVGSSPGGVEYGTDCRVGRLDPRTMDLVSFAVASCGMNVTAGDGALYLETAVADEKSQTYAVHIERFSTATHASTVYPAVSATLFLGSDIAHTQLGYFGGSLWLYAQRGSPEVLQLSASTGAVEHKYSSVPALGGGEPLLAGTSGYVWLAGGAGTGADFVRVNISSGAAGAVRLAGDFASVYDMAGLGGQLYFLYLKQGTRPGAQPLENFIGRLAANGAAVRMSPEEAVGTALVDDAGQIFSVGPGNTCTGGLPVWRVDGHTLRTALIATLGPPGNPCLGDEGDRPAAAAGGSVFVLYSAGHGAVLYGVAPAGPSRD